MKWIEQLNIASRIGVGFGILLLLAALMGALALASLQRTGGAVNGIVQNEWVKANAAASIDTLTRANARRTMELFFVDEAGAAAVRARIAENRQGIDDALAVLERLVVLDDGKARLAELKKARVAYVQAFSEVDRLLKAGQREAAQVQLLGQTLPTLDGLQKHVAALSAFQSQLAADTGEQVAQDIRGALIALSGLGLAMLAAAAGLGWWLARAIARPIEQAVQMAENVAAGEMGHRLESNQGGEPGRLMRALEQMDQSLARLVGRVRVSSRGMPAWLRRCSRSSRS